MGLYTEGSKRMQGKCVIIGAGDLTVGEFHINDEDFIIAVDGGLSYCGALSIEPDLIIGDFDSVSDEEFDAVMKLQQEIPDRIVRLKPEKDDTDMLAALRLGLERGYDTFHIYAGTGGRLDHTLANIQCLLFLKNNDATGYLIDGNGMILVIKDEKVSFRENMEGFMSLFTLGREAKGVTIENMKYELSDYTMTNDYPIGISNEFVGRAASVTVKEGELVCILQY